jgi:DNA-binding MarR family transcriptional regulator
VKYAPLSEHQLLDVLLAQVSRLHHHRAHELLDKIGMYRGQPHVIDLLHEQDGLTHTELAEQLEVTPATVTKMIQRMEKAGFLRRKPDPDDQRVSRVYLTKAGRAVRLKLQAFQQQMDRDSFRGFSEEERTVLRGFLQRLRENLTQALQGNLPE